MGPFDPPIERVAVSSDSRESTWRVMSEYENAIVRCDYLGRAWFETDGLCDFRAKQRLRCRPDIRRIA